MFFTGGPTVAIMISGFYPYWCVDDSCKEVIEGGESHDEREAPSMPKKSKHEENYEEEGETNTG